MNNSININYKQMKKRILSILMVLMCTYNVQAQFWEGLLYGLIYGLGNVAESSMYSNSYNNSSSYTNSSSSSSSVEKEYKVEDDGFTWYKLRKNVNRVWKFGIANSSGTTLISPKYDLVYWSTDDKCFYVENNGYEGAVSKTGKVIIAPDKYKSIFYSSVGGTFKYENSSGEYISLNIDNEGNKINTSNYAESSSSSSSGKKKSSSSSDAYVTCPNCSGTGQIFVYGAYGSHLEMCKLCYGTGKQKVSSTPQFQMDLNTPPINWTDPAITNSGTYDNNNNTNNPGLEKAKEYNDSFGEKDCHLCHGSGTCQTCNGKGWYYNQFGTGKVTCPNCCPSHTGKCGKCCGTGKTYGKKY